MESWFPFCIIFIFFVTCVDITEFLPCEIIIRIGICLVTDLEAKFCDISIFIYFPCASCSYRRAGNFSITIMIAQFTYIPTCDLILRLFTCIRSYHAGACFYFRASCQIRIICWIICCFPICLIQYIQKYRQFFFWCCRVNRIAVSPYRINSYIFFCNINGCHCFIHVIFFIHLIDNRFICTPTLEFNISAILRNMSRFYCIIQCSCFTFFYLFICRRSCTTICIIGQCNCFFHRFFFGNFNFQISIRYQTKLIFPFADSYLIIIVSCHGNTDLFTGTNQFILRQYDFRNIPCSYIFRIGRVPEIVNGFISAQTISICKIFLTIKTYLFVKIETWQVIEVCFCSFIHIHTDRTIYGIPKIFFACICPNASQCNITCNCKFCNNILVFIIPATKFVAHYRFGHTFYCIGFAFLHNIRFWSLIICGNVTLYHITNNALTRIWFYSECHINGVRCNDIFKGICIGFFVFTFRNILAIYCNGVNNISGSRFDFKYLIFTIFHFYRFFSIYWFFTIKNSAVVTCGCCDSRVEIRIDVVDNRLSCYFKICCQTIDRNDCIPFFIRIIPIIT